MVICGNSFQNNTKIILYESIMKVLIHRVKPKMIPSEHVQYEQYSLRQ